MKNRQRSICETTQPGPSYFHPYQKWPASTRPSFDLLPNPVMLPPHLESMEGTHYFVTWKEATDQQRIILIRSCFTWNLIKPGSCLIRALMIKWNHIIKCEYLIAMPPKPYSNASKTKFCQQLLHKTIQSSNESNIRHITK